MAEEIQVSVEVGGRCGAGEGGKGLGGGGGGEGQARRGD